MSASIVALLLLLIWSYLPVLRAGFIDFDDDVYVTENPHVLQGLTWDSIVWSFSNTNSLNWHPVTWLSHLLDVQLFGLNPLGHHSVNFLLHAVNTFLLLLVLLEGTRAVWPSFFVASVFALHPVHVESVAWIAERKDVLSTFFFLLTLLAYVRYVEHSKSQDPGPLSPGSAPRLSRRLWILEHGLWISVLFYVLGLMSKPMLVTVPFVLLLLDYWPLQRIAAYGLPTKESFFGLLREKAMFFVLAAVVSIVAFQVQEHGGATHQLAHVQFSRRLGNAAISYMRYVGKLVWPANLGIFYPYRDWPLTLVIGSIVLLLVVSLSALWLGRRQRYLFTGWFWFVGTLVPVIGLVQVGRQSIADRYTYIPSIGLLTLFAWSIRSVVLPLARRTRLCLVAPCFTIVLLVCAAQTRHQAGFWADSESVWTRAVAVSADNYVAHNNLSLAFQRSGRPDRALAELREVARLRPNDPDAYCNLGNGLCRIGQFDEGFRQYQRALQLDANSFEAHFNFGYSLCAHHQYEQGIGELQRAVQLRPDNANAEFMLGAALAQLGRREDALVHISNALKLRPDYPEARQALDELGAP
jgi:Flp pilus assembly protein TadD